MNILGVMQGRLIPDENGKIQSFPRINWRLEFPILKELGLNYLEWTLDHNELWKNPILTPKGLLEIRELGERNHVEIYSATADNLMQAPIHKLKTGLATTTQECIEFLALLDDAGIQVVVWPLVDSGNLDSKEEFEKFIELFEPISKSLEKKRIRIVFETDLTPEYSLKLIQEINSNSVGINLDIGNTASYGGKTSREFDILGSLIQHVHVKDRIFRGTTVPLGSGDVDWVDTAGSMKLNYKGIRILQTARKTDNIQAIREYLRFCEKVGL
jgi:hexulose-6-phosphate isomerase